MNALESNYPFGATTTGDVTAILLLFLSADSNDSILDEMPL